MLKCPICQSALEKCDRTYKCVNNHCFDLSKTNYLNLLRTNSKDHGDNNDLIMARRAFLNNGYYKPLLDAINGIIHKYHINSLIDLGCGEGYYTNQLNVATKVGIDMSKKAIEYASKADKENKTQYIIASIFDIPVEDHYFDAALLIFAPFPQAEVQRILKTHGYFIEVLPDVNHLSMLKDIVYDNVLLNPQPPIRDIKLIESCDLHYKIDLNNDNLINLFMMTPYSYKTSIDDFNKLKTTNQAMIDCHFVINIYQI